VQGLPRAVAPAVGLAAPRAATRVDTPAVLGCSPGTGLLHSAAGSVVVQVLSSWFEAAPGRAAALRQRWLVLVLVIPMMLAAVSVRVVVMGM